MTKNELQERAQTILGMHKDDGLIAVTQALRDLLEAELPELAAEIAAIITGDHKRIILVPKTRKAAEFLEVSFKEGVAEDYMRACREGSDDVRGSTEAP